MKQILSKLRRASQDYNMIEDGDKICVGVSGGKDSMLLLKALADYRRFSPERFELYAVCIDLGLGCDYARLREYCDSLNVELSIKQTQIAQIVFDVRKETNPCALCSKLKRGALHNEVLALGAKKLALGHHADDFMETFLLGLLYEGRIHTFMPVTYLDRKEITVIRPMLYMREKDVIYAANRNNVPVVKSNCPADGHTKREDMKEQIRKWEREIPSSSERLFTAVKEYVDKQMRINKK